MTDEEQQQERLMWIDIRLADVTALDSMLKRYTWESYAILSAVIVAFVCVILIKDNSPWLRIIPTVLFGLLLRSWYMRYHAKVVMDNYKDRWGKLEPGEPPAMTPEVRLLVANWKLQKEQSS